jgi:hypothetical protein
MKNRYMFIPVALVLLVGCRQSARIETVQLDVESKEEFVRVFHAEGYTNRLEFIHVEKISRPESVEYAIKAKDLDHPEFTGGPSLTLTKTGEKWTVVARGSWQQ